MVLNLVFAQSVALDDLLTSLLSVADSLLVRRAARIIGGLSRHRGANLGGRLASGRGRARTRAGFADHPDRPGFLCRTEPNEAALFVQIELENLGGTTLETAVHARVDAKAGEAKFVDGVLRANGRVILVAADAWRLAEDERLVQSVNLPPGGKRTVELVQPCDEIVEVPETSPPIAKRASTRHWANSAATGTKCWRRRPRSKCPKHASSTCTARS